MKSRAISTIPQPLLRELQKFGLDLKNARIRRKLTMRDVAERSFISRSTLFKVERGDPTVAMGVYVTVLSILGIRGRMGNLADFKSDTIALDLEEEALPKRVRS